MSNIPDHSQRFLPTRAAHVLPADVRIMLPLSAAGALDTLLELLRRTDARLAPLLQPVGR